MTTPVGVTVAEREPIMKDMTAQAGFCRSNRLGLPPLSWMNSIQRIKRSWTGHYASNLNDDLGLCGD